MCYINFECEETRLIQTFTKNARRKRSKEGLERKFYSKKKLSDIEEQTQYPKAVIFNLLFVAHFINDFKTWQDTKKKDKFKICLLKSLHDTQRKIIGEHNLKYITICITKTTVQTFKDSK